MDQLTIRWAADGCRGVTKPLRGDSTACYVTQFRGEWRSVLCSHSEWTGEQGLVLTAVLCSAPPILSWLSGKQTLPFKGDEFFLSWNSGSSTELGCVRYPTTWQRVKVLRFYSLLNFQYDVIFSVLICNGDYTASTCGTLNNPTLSTGWWTEVLCLTHVPEDYFWRNPDSPDRFGGEAARSATVIDSDVVLELSAMFYPKGLWTVAYVFP